MELKERLLENMGLLYMLAWLIIYEDSLSIVAIDDDQETGDMNGWVMVSNEDLQNKTGNIHIVAR